MAEKNTSPRILILSYYWPPSGGAGVQRWLKFTKHWGDYCQPIVYTAENAEYPAIDESLLADVHPNAEVLKTPIWEPYALYKRFVGRKKDSKIATGFTSEKGKVSSTEKLSRWIRGNMFIPDARKFWIKPSISYLKNYLRENPVDAIVSTGPPHSMHLIARALKKEFGMPWVADFRDPWTEIDFIDDLNLTVRSERKHERMEMAVLNEADAVVNISKTWSDRMAIKQGNAEKFFVVPNGFDPDDFSTENVAIDAKFTLAHVGSFTPTRNVPTLWEVLRELVHEDEAFAKDFELKLAGTIDGSVQALVEENGLSSFLNIYPYMSHSEVTKFMASSQLLLLIVNQAANSKGIITGKVFEYLNTQRPVLSIGPADGDLAKLMQEVGALPTSDYTDKAQLKSTILKSYEAFKNGGLAAKHVGLEKYERGAQARVFFEIVQRL